MHHWAQFVSLLLSLVGFSVSLLPRTRDEHFLSRAKRLAQFPLLWAGLLVVAYVAIQGVNSAWKYESNADSWWLKPVTFINWLPSGVDAPFSRSNPWSSLLVYASLWLLLCSIWSGLSRRRSYRTLFTVLVVNAALLALLGLLQQLTHAKQIFWAYTPSNGDFTASFIYRNHAGAYFNLMVALAASLACHHQRRARQQNARSSPAVMFAFLAIVIATIVLFSFSRGSICVLAIFALASLVTWIWRLFTTRSKAQHRRAGPLLATLCAGSFLVVCLLSFQTGRIGQRFSQIFRDASSQTSVRLQTAQAASEMLTDHMWFGFGAGCFRHGFPLYAQNHPSIYHSPNGGLRFWQHAHCDLLEFPIELGVAGMLPLLFSLGYLCAQLARARFWENEATLSLVFMCALLIVHASVDFIFQNPAVLFTWSVLLLSSTRWLSSAMQRPASSSNANRQTACIPAPRPSSPA